MNGCFYGAPYNIIHMAVPSIIGLQFVLSAVACHFTKGWGDVLLAINTERYVFR